MTPTRDDSKINVDNNQRTASNIVVDGDPSMIQELTRSFLADNSQTGICLCPWLAFHISCSPLAGRPSINSSSSISRSSNTSLVGSVGRRADLHRVWTRCRSTLPWNKRRSDEQAQCIFLPSDSVVSVIRSSPDKSTSLPARFYFDFSLPRPGLFHTTVHTTCTTSRCTRGMQGIVGRA